MLSSKANSVQLVNNAAALLRRTAAPFLVILSIVLAGRAQQSNAPDPDYSSVKDILRGRRTLLSINDLVIGGTVLKTSDGSKIEDKNISELPGFQRRTGDLETLAHLFDSKAGTLVYLHEKALYAIDPVLQSTTSLNLNEFTSLAAIASADFKLDGHQEIVIASRSGVRLVSAVDPVDFSKGLLAGPKAAFQAFSNFRPAVALGDFNGDGFPEIAVVYETLLENRRRLNIYQVDPQTLALDLKHSQLLADHNSGSVVAVSLAVGQFGTTLRDQLLLGYFSTGNLLAFMSFGFDESLAPILKDTRTVPGLTLQELDLGTGRFNPASPFSQVAAKLDQGRANVQVGIISLDSDLKVRLPNFVARPG